LLWRDGKDLRDTPLIERKEALKEILDRAPSALAYVEYLESDGRRMFEHVVSWALKASSRSARTRLTAPDGLKVG